MHKYRASANFVSCAERNLCAPTEMDFLGVSCCGEPYSDFIQEELQRARRLRIQNNF